MYPLSDDTPTPARLRHDLRERIEALESLGNRLLAIVHQAISAGMPITSEITDARNLACKLLPKSTAPKM